MFDILFDPKQLPELLFREGVVPLPPYIRSRASEVHLRDRYQTIFAEHPASVAAPTAALHFTPQLFEKLKGRGVEFAYITLHVGLGTFAPLRSEQLISGKLHLERYVIDVRSATAIAHAKRSGRPIVAVGTTVVRTLESAADAILAGESASGVTELFIRPGYSFRVVDALVTNFHVPSSSLIWLVDAFMQHKGASRHILELYTLAIQNRFRFFSFGDAMLIA